jgi:hypothetical protein
MAPPIYIAIASYKLMRCLLVTDGNTIYLGASFDGADRWFEEIYRGHHGVTTEKTEFPSGEST